MSCYQNMLIRLSRILLEGKLPYNDTIIIGDNSSGKSDILKKMIEDSDGSSYYFIDAVNRYFDIAQIMSKWEQEILFSKEINIHRLKEDNFNHKDSFYYGGTPKAVEDFYINYSDELNELMKEFLDIQFEIKRGTVGWEVYIDGEKETLSSGYQALLRLFIEIVYYEKTKKIGIVVIDEIDEFLSVKNCGEIYGFLRKKFPALNFVVTTHSADLVANTENANLILLQNGEFEVLDSGDFSSISQVYDIFEAVLERDGEKSEKEKIDDRLRILLNNKMSGVWESEDEKKLADVKNQNLTKAQKLIIKQIEEW